ncbi:MAG: hypothetical protein PF961_11685 [Planctomycetota bacterium]|jgi:hypothetical protein|nr:hypothetical protein [Planctomycetota bacterium]
MEYLVFRSAKSHNRVVVPAQAAMIVDRSDGSVVIYAIGGNGRERMVWEVPEIAAIRVTSTMQQALSMHLPGSDNTGKHGMVSTGKTEVVQVE